MLQTELKKILNQRLRGNSIDQRSATDGPGAGFGPPRHFTRHATFHCHPARNLFFIFNCKYAAIKRRNDPHLLAKIFFLVFAINSAERRRKFLAKTFLFWSVGMVAALWNLVTTGCAPLIQKVAGPWRRQTQNAKFIK